LMINITLVCQYLPVINFHDCISIEEKDQLLKSHFP
jgi:hypothetical protein